MKVNLQFQLNFLGSCNKSLDTLELRTPSNDQRNAENREKMCEIISESRAVSLYISRQR